MAPEIHKITFFVHVCTASNPFFSRLRRKKELNALQTGNKIIECKEKDRETETETETH